MGTSDQLVEPPADSASNEERGRRADDYANLLAYIEEADGKIGELQRAQLESSHRRRVLDAEIESMEAAVELARAALSRAEEDLNLLDSRPSSSPFEVVDARDAVMQARRELGQAEELRAERLRELRRVKAELEGEHERAAMEVQRALSGRETVRSELQALQDEQRRAQAAALKVKFDEMAPVVEAQREALGESGTAELAAEYDQRATSHKKQGRTWLLGLVAAVACVIAAVFLLFRVNAADADAAAAEIVAHVGVNAVVLGMLVFVARIASAQFRAQRHMEEVARNKAAALRTFNRLVVTSGDPEVRTAIATVLAQNVFASTDTGLLTDVSSDQVTFVERIIPTLSQRPA